MRYIRIESSIEVDGHWFLENHTFEVTDQSFRMVECFACGQTPREYAEIHYHVLVDGTVYHIPAHACAYFNDNTISAVSETQKTSVEEWVDRVMKDPIIDEFNGDYMKAHEYLTGIDIRAKEGDNQASMPHPDALNELIDKKISEGKYKKLPSPGLPTDGKP